MFNVEGSCLMWKVDVNYCCAFMWTRVLFLAAAGRDQPRESSHPDTRASPVCPACPISAEGS